VDLAFGCRRVILNGKDLTSNPFGMAQLYLYMYVYMYACIHTTHGASIQVQDTNTNTNIIHVWGYIVCWPY